MSDSLKHARQARMHTISRHECRAIRALDRSPNYTRSEIAFIFETKVETVRRHADQDCSHNRERGPNTGEVDGFDIETLHREFSDDALLEAFRAVYDKQPYERMSEATYDEYADSDDPNGSLIRNRFGGWTDARAKAFPNRSETNE